MTAGHWRRTVSGGALLALLISSGVFVASAGLFFAWSTEQVSVAEQKHTRAELKLMAKEQTQKEADARTAVEVAERRAVVKRSANQDKIAEDLGYELIAFGIYYKVAADGYHCSGESACASFTVMSGEACTSGVAVTVGMYKDDVFIGAVYGVTEGVPAGGVARLNVELLPEVNTYRVTEAHCQG